ncbi:MltA domain-containing protein [Telmatospirillum sp.]|uniref:murein transglycosylase A n=1 Tax=Telmatospirillum sp. TaxID=2079197 RepID=UPI002845DFDD|nr:MltA domain-containing protein [Telmatospirillum sp.]MDR3439615.1 MltA domain-containing protein [Telmatospirillum sp.]
MTKRSAVCGSVLLGCALLLAACATSPKTASPVAQGPDRLVLTPVGYNRLPGWRSDVLTQALPAFRRSCERITQLPPGQPIGSDGSGGLAGDWLAPCGALRRVSDGDPEAARTYFESWFQPFQAANGARTDGLFTGYFESELKGSRTRGGPYQVPLYARPSGLPADPGQAYFSRAEIEQGALEGKASVLVWVADAVDAHILQIQGSGRIRFDDGTVSQIGYNGSNGRKYVGLGQILLNHGKITLEDVTMQTVRRWLKSHPAEAPAMMAENPRYVFFRFTSGDSPTGSAGVPLTPGRSLAVDQRFVPLGIPLWLDSADPDGIPLRRLMIAQDTGTAIKGPVRGDVFWGAGDAAFDKAGRMKSSGSYYLLLPRERSAPVALGATAAGPL